VTHHRRQTASNEEETEMQWTTPRIVEIAIGLEINSYASAGVA
jgi:coenzyme PQQ precursor peptide PqqA